MDNGLENEMICQRVISVGGTGLEPAEKHFLCYATFIAQNKQKYIEKTVAVPKKLWSKARDYVGKTIVVTLDARGDVATFVKALGMPKTKSKKGKK